MDQVTSVPRGGPPRVEFHLRLGVTGHRSASLAEKVATIEDRIDRVLGDVLTIARRIATKQAAFFDQAPPVFTMLSPLADGADQSAARLALRRGMKLWSVLPFGPTEYEKDFCAAADRAYLTDLLSQSDCVLELPGDRDDALHAYLMAGRATIAHCDLLIAVWDGKPPRGRGGTGEIVQLALHEGRPIVHIPVDADQPIRLLWSAYDPHVRGHRRSSQFAGRPYDEPSFETLLKRLIEPPHDPREREFLLSYYGERERRWGTRLEYPLLLAMTGVSPLRLGDIRRPPFAKAIANEWAEFRAGCASSGRAGTDLDGLQTAYCWSDLLARHFAQTYRSGHVFNFLFGALAVLIALSGLLLPQGKMVLAIAELAVIASVIVNTRVGVTRGWHRRWLDYRNLAERLRPMRSLTLLTIAAPASIGVGGALRWIDWYAIGIWRSLRPTTVRLADAAKVVRTLVAEELVPQIAYHKKAAERAERLDHRLHMIGTTLFVASILGCIVVVVGNLAFAEWTQEHAKMFVVLSAGLPALGTAIFGIRVQGDFSGTALRSRATAERIQAIASEIGSGENLSRAADLFERGADAMLEDLGEWRLAHRQRELVIP